MARVAFKKACPSCSSRRFRRIERKPWMRYLPQSKYYRCNQCRTYLLVIYDRLSWRVG